MRDEQLADGIRTGLNELIAALHHKQVMRDVILKALRAAHDVVGSAPVRPEDWPELIALEDALLELHQLAQAEADTAKRKGLMPIETSYSIASPASNGVDITE